MEKGLLIAVSIEVMAKGYKELAQEIVPGCSVRCVLERGAMPDEYAAGNYSMILMDPTYLNGASRYGELEKVRKNDEDVPIYVIGEKEFEVDAMRAGATGFIDYLQEDYFERIGELFKRYLSE